MRNGGERVKNKWELEKVILNNEPSDIIFWVMKRKIHNDCGDYIEIEESRGLYWWERIYYRLAGEIA